MKKAKNLILILFIASLAVEYFSNTYELINYPEEITLSLAILVVASIIINIFSKEEKSKKFLNKEVIKRTKIYNKQYFTAESKMNSVVKYLINNNFSIKLLCKIEKIIKENDKWFVIGSDQVSFGPYDWLIITIPPNQAKEILYNKLMLILQYLEDGSVSSARTNLEELIHRIQFNKV